MEFRSLIDKLQSPSFRAVAEIARHAGAEMIVTRNESIRFPTGTVQVWEFTPYRQPSDRPPVVVAVLLRDKKIERWKPLDLSFEAAVAHWQAAERGVPSPSAPTPTVSSPLVRRFPEPPPGVRLILPPPRDGRTGGGLPVRETS